MTTLRKARATVRLPGTLADMPARAFRSPSAVRPADRLRAKDLAALEGCSPGTARKLMRSGELGPVHGRNRRDRWIDRLAYQSYLDVC